MAHWIELTAPDNTLIFFNTSCIVGVINHADKVYVVPSAGEPTEVKEDYKTVKLKIVRP